MADPGWGIWGKCPPPPPSSLQPWWKSHTSFDRNTIHLVKPKSTHENCILPPLLQTHLKSKLKQLSNSPSTFVHTKNNYRVAGV